MLHDAGIPIRNRTLQKTGAIAIVWAGATACTLAAGSDEATGNELRVHTQPAQVTLGFESVRLPKSEAMGLLGASYLVEFAPGWWSGPALYGAAAGQRGGLFTWGAEAKRNWQPAPQWAVAAGLYVGGGGGASAPVGGGLMLRPHVDLMRDFGAWAAGITASQVRFPSGSIASSQLGMQVTLAHDFRFTAPGYGGRRIESIDTGGLQMDRMDVAVGRYAAGSGSGRALGYVGVRLNRQIDAVVSASFEAAGAATGSADGYAEALVGLQALWPLGSETFRIGLRAGAGLGGGGAAATAGGPIGKLALAGRLQLGPQWSVELDTGQARALHGDFKTPYVQLALGMALAGAPLRDANASAASTLHDMHWALSLQEVLHAQRRDGRVQPMSLLGLKFNRLLNQHVYLSGQALSAVGGGAGAYSAGLVGLGATTRLAAASPWRMGAEALVGAGGGGGVSSSGGAIAQPMAWLGRELGDYIQVKLGAGYVKSLRGELSSPVLDLSWAVRFGVF